MKKEKIGRRTTVDLEAIVWAAARRVAGEAEKHIRSAFVGVRSTHPPGLSDLPRHLTPDEAQYTAQAKARLEVETAKAILRVLADPSVLATIADDRASARGARGGRATSGHYAPMRAALIEWDCKRGSKYATATASVRAFIGSLGKRDSIPNERVAIQWVRAERLRRK